MVAEGVLLGQNQLPLSATGPPTLKRTGFGSIVNFYDTPFARSRSFYRRRGGRCCGLVRRAIGA